MPGRRTHVAREAVLLLAALAAPTLAAKAGAEEPRDLAAARAVVGRYREVLAAAQRREDEAEVRRIADESIAALGAFAGTPEVADRYEPAPADVPAFSAAEARAGFPRLLRFVRAKRWWRIGLDPTTTEHAPREVAAAIAGCLAGVRAGVPGRDELLAEAVAGGDYLLRTQQEAGSGVIPFPACRTGRDAAFQSAERFLRRAEQAGRLDEFVRNGWIFDDADDGGLQFDNGLGGSALLELHAATDEPRFLAGARAAADWASTRPCVPNWNYNAFSVELLAAAHRATGEANYLEAARKKARLGVLPGQLTAGPRAGRWADPHNARPAYHYILLRGLVALLRELPADAPERAAVVAALQRGLASRNREFAEQGVMHVDGALETLLAVETLSPELRDALGPCEVGPALAALEARSADRLRCGEAPLGPGAAGRWFEFVLSRAAR